MIYLFLIPALLSFFIYTGCNSSIYEIVEVEETVDIKEDVKPVADGNEEIKDDIKEETKPIENKSNDNQIVSKNYVVQIGAFTDEVNAGRFTRSAKQTLSGEEIYYKDIDGLFKVRLGNFSSKTDAINMMEKVKLAGFPDSFVVELTYKKVESN